MEHPERRRRRQRGVDARRSRNGPLHRSLGTPIRPTASAASCVRESETFTAHRRAFFVRSTPTVEGLLRAGWLRLTPRQLGSRGAFSVPFTGKRVETRRYTKATGVTIGSTASEGRHSLTRGRRKRRKTPGSTPLTRNRSHPDRGRESGRFARRGDYGARGSDLWCGVCVYDRAYR